MRRRNSSPSIRSRPTAIRICAFRMWRSTASTRPARIRAAYFPLAALRRAVAAGRVGALAQRFHGAPTNRSHRVTLETDCPELVARCRPIRPMPPCSSPIARSAIRAVSLAARALEDGRHRHRRHGLRQGHRRTCRACRAFSFPIFRSAMRREGLMIAPARMKRSHLALTLLEARLGTAHHGAESVALERRSVVEARLRKYRAAFSGRDRPAPRRFRQAEAGRKGGAQA